MAHSGPKDRTPSAAAHDDFLPVLVARRGRVFAGRTEELAKLRQAWRSAAAGDRRLVLLAGEPGIGKTRLATQFAAELHRRQAGRVLAGRCDEDLAVPYQPFVEALRDVARNDAAPALGRYSADLIRLVPDLGAGREASGAPLRSDPQTERYRLFDAVAAWLSQASTRTPLLLFLDDLQWATKPTLLMLRHVLRSPEPLRCLIVATYRDSELGPGHPLSELSADLWSEPAVDRLTLSGLDRAAVGQLVEAAGGRRLTSPAEAAFVDAVHHRTDGHPFFVLETLRHLVESGAVALRAGRWTVTEPIAEVAVPCAVGDLTARRLARLSEPARQWLSAAAVAGLQFDTAVVAEAAGLDEPGTILAAGEAVTARFVTETGPGQHRFTHALVRDALYSRLSAPARRVLHRLLAAAIEARLLAPPGGPPEQYWPALARHWTAAAATRAETDRAAECATRAGRQALEQLADDEAAAHFTHALQLVGADPADARRPELLTALGQAQQRAGDPAHRATLLQATHLAVSRGDGAGAARAALANTRRPLPSDFGSVDTERVGALQATLETLGDTDDAARARLLAALALENIPARAGDRSVALSDQALLLARRTGDDAVLAEVLLARHYATHRAPLLGQRLAETAELMTIAPRLADPVLRCWAALIRFRNLAEAGDASAAAAAIAAAEPLAREVGHPFLTWQAQCYRIGWLLWRGELTAAAAGLEQARRLGSAGGQHDSEGWYALQGFCLRREQGRLPSFTAVLRRQAAAIPGAWSLPVLLAKAHADAGRTAEAAALLAPIARDGFTCLPDDSFWTLGITTAAAVAVQLGDRATAEAAHRRMAPHADLVAATVGGTPCGSFHHHLALVDAAAGRYAQAEERFAAATTRHAAMGAPTWSVHTSMAWGRMLLARARARAGDRARGEAMIRDVAAAAAPLGMGGTARQAAALLGDHPTASRPTPPVDGHDPWLSLSPAERKVTELLPEGLTNSQMAARLFVSRHTVETHLKHVFTKLGAASRTEVAAQAARRAPPASDRPDGAGQAPRPA